LIHRLTSQMTPQEFKIRVFPLKNKLYRFSKRILDDPEEAKDIVQEVFIKLWNKRENLAEYRSIEALAMVTTRNLCLDKLKIKKYPSESIDKLRDEVEETRYEEKRDLSDIVQKIHHIIKALPELQRTIIQLRDIEGYDFDEISGILDMNENAVRVNLSRARKKIREILVNNKFYEYKRN
jgi:RNA polymerase sigma factor (sigma-70 family)